MKDTTGSKWFAESGGVRPFGVSLLMAGYDENGPQLYQIDPSGTYFAWKASAIGKNMVSMVECHNWRRRKNNKMAHGQAWGATCQRENLAFVGL